jgi:hypothetical protein
MKIVFSEVKNEKVLFMKRVREGMKRGMKGEKVEQGGNMMTNMFSVKRKKLGEKGKMWK